MRSSTVLPFLLATAANAQSCAGQCPLYTLAFADEFSGTAVDETVWNYRTDRKALSAQLPANVGINNGFMEIALKKETVGTFSYTGGGLISKPNFHYGYYEARLKINAGGGWHSSFWQMAGNGSNTYKTAAPNWTEIDTFEIDSASPTKIRNNIFSWKVDPVTGASSAAEQSTGVYTTTTDFSADYHVFGTLWNETTMTFFTDNQQVGIFTYSAKSWPHDYLNIWITCIGYSSPILDSALPSKVSTDYVRFYQRDYYLTATSLCRGNYQGSTPCPSTEGYSETGLWSQSAVDGYTLALKSRYSCSVAGNTATWSQTLPAAATYDVSAWIIARSDSDPAAVYTVRIAGVVVQTVTINQTSGSARWVTLYSGASVTAGHTIKVTIEASGSGCARSDAVKLVRVA